MKTMLITGGSGAIGSMTAYLGVRSGYNIILAYHQNEQAAHQLKTDLEALGGQILLVQGDLTREQDRERLIRRSQEWGGIDVLVNNFGVARYGLFTDESTATLTQMLNTNLLAHMDLTRLALPAMLAQKKGAIINISSVWGQTGASCEVAYSAAKAGLIGFTKALAKELAPSGITVNCVAPGVVESNMLGDLDREALKEMIPTGKLTSGLDVAAAILFLARQEQITGQVLSPNGGMYM